MEFVDAFSYDLTTTNIEGVYNPFTTEPQVKDCYYVLIELSSNSDLQDLQDNLLTNIQDKIPYDDCIIDLTDAQRNNIWHIREACSIACA